MAAIFAGWQAFSVFYLDGREQDSAVYVGSVDSNDKKKLISVATIVVFAEPGYLIFQKNGLITARPFDPTKLQFTGQEVQITDSSWSDPTTWGFAAISV